MKAVSTQLRWETGKQDVICPDCSKPMTIRVGKAIKGGFAYKGRTYRNYSGSCRHCGTYYSALLYR